MARARRSVSWAPQVGREASFPYPELKPEEAAPEALPLFTAVAAAYGDRTLDDTVKALAARYPASPTNFLAGCGRLQEARRLPGETVGSYWGRIAL